MISYKALVAGIEVIWQEESYTSKADCTAGDLIPVYGKERTHPVFSGRRIERGLYLCKAGYCINADCNGAANILRKRFRMHGMHAKISNFCQHLLLSDLKA